MPPLSLAPPMHGVPYEAIAQRAEHVELDDALGAEGGGAAATSEVMMEVHHVHSSAIPHGIGELQHNVVSVVIGACESGTWLASGRGGVHLP